MLVHFSITSDRPLQSLNLDHATAMTKSHFPKMVLVADDPKTKGTPPASPETPALPTTPGRASRRRLLVSDKSQTLMSVLGTIDSSLNAGALYEAIAVYAIEQCIRAFENLPLPAMGCK